jgi:hypothetical protein
MKRSRAVLACALLAACSVMACSGVSSDGGQSGTGIAAIRGDVVAVTGASPDVANIRVSLAGTNLATRTDADGRFELRGDASGPAELRFERERDGLFARTDVVIPAGGILELEQIVLDSNSGKARPTRRLVEFEGFVEALDCTNGAILVTPKEEEDVATVFTVEAMSATIRNDGALLACRDLQVGDRLQVRAETSDGSTLINAEVKLEDREDPPGGDPDDQGDDQPDDHQDDGQPEDHQDDGQLEDHQGDDQPENHQGDHQPEDHAGDDPENDAREAAAESPRGRSLGSNWVDGF